MHELLRPVNDDDDYDDDDSFDDDEANYVVYCARNPFHKSTSFFRIDKKVHFGDKTFHF